MVTGSCHTHLARSWLGTEDLDCVMSLDEDIRAHKVDTTPGTHLQHCPGARLCSRCATQRRRETTESTSYRQADFRKEAAYPGVVPNPITPQ